ncbi:hypothetical protein [Prochlorococcus sp. MIT 1300]|uniref:hypothetical protein n=1 Tax=Prochlorococcus sp. MIT 1300 TaxID=3096218 RepID=UPI002A762FBA|nr:hypothetical protein [Prochlorococcus sp. MIT 1300]
MLKINFVKSHWYAILIYCLLFPTKAYSGVNEFTPLDQVEDWVIERRVNSTTNKVLCRAFLPNNSTWFSGRIRLDIKNQLIIPEEMLNTRLPELSSIKKVINALKNCRSSLIYLKES